VATGEADKTTVEPAAGRQEGDAAPTGLYLGELALKDFGITYSDAALAREPMTFVVKDLGLDVQDLMVLLAVPPTAFSSVQLDASLEQGEYPPALLTLLARVGPIEAGLPAVNAQAKLSGFMLDTLGSLVPPGVRTTLGANGAGIRLSLALDPEFIDLQGRVESDAGHDYPVYVRGPLAKPEVNLGPIAMAVAGRLTGGVANLTVGTAGAARDVAVGVTSGAEDLAKGAEEVAGKVGEGLFKSARAALTLDLGGVEEGLKQATLDAASEAGQTVQEAGGGMADTAREGLSSVKGDKATTAWLEGTPERHARDVEAARTALQKMTFPPRGLDSE
jgi:hypothetical protein